MHDLVVKIHQRLLPALRNLVHKPRRASQEMLADVSPVGKEFLCKAPVLLGFLALNVPR